jgi:hypothetical protein
MCGRTMWDAVEKRIANGQVRGTVAISHKMGSMMAMLGMPIALQTQRNEGVKEVSKAKDLRMLSNATTCREASADDTSRIRKHSP